MLLHDEKSRTQVASPETPVMVRAEEITKRFGSVKALQDVSFSLRKSEILGLLGPNGAGKTTAMRILAGYFSPTSGRVWIGEKDLSKDPPRLKARIGYLPENLGIYRDLQVLEYLTLVAHLKGVARSKRKKDIEEKMERCGLWQVKHRLIGNLSKGFRQRLGLAQALMGDPDVLLLDEPTSGLDPKQIMEIRALIRELGQERTLILSTHILPEVSMICDRVLILSEGRVAAEGTVEELEAGLQNATVVTVIVGDRHRKQETLELFQKTEGVLRVTLLKEDGDRVYFSLMVSKGREIRPEISRLCVQQQIPLLELHAEKLSLEEIFLKLVVKEPAFKETSW